MGIFSIFRKPPAPQPRDFCDISLSYSRVDNCWQQSDLEFWGFRSVDLTIDADEAGPSSEQASEYWRLVKAKDSLLPRLFAALQSQEAEPAHFVLVGVHIPRLDGSKAGELARFWFDRVGDDHFMYGVESTDRWQTMQAHRDD